MREPPPIVGVVQKCQIFPVDSIPRCGDGILDGGEACAGASLTHDGRTVGRVTSAVQSFKLDRRIGLGYIKSDLAESDTRLLAVDGDSETNCKTCEIPFS